MKTILIYIIWGAFLIYAGIQIYKINTIGEKYREGDFDASWKIRKKLLPEEKTLVKLTYRKILIALTISLVLIFIAGSMFHSE